MKWPWVSRATMDRLMAEKEAAAQKILKSAAAEMEWATKELRTLRSHVYGGGVFDEYDMAVNPAGDAEFDRLLLSDGFSRATLGLRGPIPILQAYKRGDGGHLTEQIQETTGIGAAAGTGYVRRDLGDNERINARAAAVWWYWQDPVGRNVINAPTHYCIGRGIRLSSPSEEIDSVLREFWTHPLNDMERRHKEQFRLLLLHGELIPLYKLLDKPPYVRVRHMHPDQLTEIYRPKDDHDTFWFFRREYFTPSGGSSLSYTTVYYATISQPDDRPAFVADDIWPSVGTQGIELVPDERAAFYGLALTDDEQGRSLPLMFPAMKTLRFRRDWVAAECFRHREAAKSVWVETLKGNDAATAIGITPHARLPKEGMWTETDSRTYRVMTPQLNVADMMAGHSTLVHEISAATGIPPQVLMLDPTDSNYASIRSADTPFVQMIGSLQDDYAPVIRDMLKLVVRQAVAKGRLPQQVKVPKETPEFIGEMVRQAGRLLGRGVRGSDLSAALHEQVQRLTEQGSVEMVEMLTVDVPINVAFPEPVHQDPDKEATAATALFAAGIASLYTTRVKLRMDPDVEAARIDKEQAASDERLAKRAAAFQRTGKLPDADGTGGEDDEEPEE